MSSSSVPPPSAAEVLRALLDMIRDADTLPDMLTVDVETVAPRVIYELLLQVSERQRRIVQVLGAMVEDGDRKHRGVLSAIARIAAR